MSLDDSLPTDLASAHVVIIAQREALSAAQERAVAAESEAQYRALLIEKLKFTIRKLQHDRFGPSSERGTRSINSSCNSPIWKRMLRKSRRPRRWQPRQRARR
jgi:hypothetical protein